MTKAVTLLVPLMHAQCHWISHTIYSQIFPRMHWNTSSTIFTEVIRVFQDPTPSLRQPILDWSNLRLITPPDPKRSGVFLESRSLHDGPDGFPAVPVMPSRVWTLHSDLPGKSVQPTSLDSQHTFQPLLQHWFTSSWYLGHFHSCASSLRYSQRTASSIRGTCFEMANDNTMSGLN